MAAHCSVAPAPEAVLLPTASVRVLDSDGNTVFARALLDSGAQGSIMSSNLAVRLGNPIYKSSHSIRGVGNVRISDVIGHTSFIFSSNPNPRLQFRVSALVMPEVIGRHPPVKVNSYIRSLTSDLRLADPKFDTPGPVDVLLGADVLGKLLLTGKRVLHAEGLVAMDTKLGHVLLGPAFRPVAARKSDNFLVGSTLSEVVQRFWELEEPPTAYRVNPDEEECELFYQNNTGRLHSGRFLLRLPFRANRPLLGSSRKAAETRLLSMERRMRRDAVFRQKYVEFMREYESLGHM
ncbi:hypothetical protein FEC35_19130, partial [Acinetobacter baumannii]